MRLDDYPRTPGSEFCFYFFVRQAIAGAHGNTCAVYFDLQECFYIGNQLLAQLRFKIYLKIRMFRHVYNLNSEFDNA